MTYYFCNYTLFPSSYLTDKKSLIPGIMRVLSFLKITGPSFQILISNPPLAISDDKIRFFFNQFLCCFPSGCMEFLSKPFLTPRFRHQSEVHCFQGNTCGKFIKSFLQLQQDFIVNCILCMC